MVGIVVQKRRDWLGATSLFAVLAVFGLAMLPQHAAAQVSDEQAPKADDQVQLADSQPTVTNKTDDDQSGDIVVTGMRASIIKSLNAKKNSNEIVEVVSAEDIGKLPGASIADSLARLPGVAAQRVDGRAQVISIRGMSPAFGVTLLNGQEMVSTGDDRSFEYDQFPAELVNSAVLYKTPNASLGTMGLSGTIDIHTLQPLDFNERKFNVSAQYDGNTMGAVIPGTKGYGSRLSLSYIDQFADGKIGVAIGYARLDTPDKRKYFNFWDYGHADEIGVENLGHDLTYDGFETGVASTKTVRNGLLGILQFKPDDHFSSKIDVFHSKFAQRMRGAEMIGITAWWASGTTPITHMGNGSLIVDNASPILTMRQDDRNDTINAVNWANTYETGAWTFRADIGISKAKRHESVGEAYMMSKTPVSLSVVLPTDLNSGFGQVTSSVDLNSREALSLTSVWGGNLGGLVAFANVNDKVETGRLTAKTEFDLGPFDSLEMGILYSHRTKTLAYEQTSFAILGSAPCLNGGVDCKSIPDSLTTHSVDMGFVGLPQMLYFQAGDALNGGDYVEGPNPLDPAWNRSTGEKITTGFLKLDIKDDNWVPIRGNIGLQVVHASQSSDGLSIDVDGNVTTASNGISYTAVLPSLNLNAQFGETTYLRFGAAKSQARPQMADMNAGIIGGVNKIDRHWYASGGNPRLKPWQSWDFDLSLEHYIGKGSYVAAAAFYKDITRGIVNKDTSFDFTGYINSSGVPAITPIGTLSGPANTSGGTVKGLEFSANLEGNLFSKLLDGVGVSGSYSKTWVKPKTDNDGIFVSALLEGYSGDVWSGSVFYEKDGFELRVAENYRSGYSAKRHNAFIYLIENIQSEHILAASMGYTVQSGPLKNLAFSLQANNLNNEPYVTSQTVYPGPDESTHGETGPQQRHKFGREIIAGVSYAF